MLVAELSWLDDSEKSCVAENPSLEMVIDKIGHMDGYFRTQVMMQGDDESPEGDDQSQLAISGGLSDLYGVYARIANVYYVVSNKDHPDEMIEMIQGGQTVDITKRGCVNLRQAKEIATCFFETGKLSDVVEWVV